MAPARCGALGPTLSPFISTSSSATSSSVTSSSAMAMDWKRGLLLRELQLLLQELLEKPSTVTASSSGDAGRRLPSHRPSTSNSCGVKPKYGKFAGHAGGATGRNTTSSLPRVSPTVLHTKLNASEIPVHKKAHCYTNVRLLGDRSVMAEDAIERPLAPSAREEILHAARI